jgi:hypothetical protein
MEGDQRFFYAKDLLVLPDELKKYQVLPELNSIFSEEFRRGKAYSDREITEKIPSIARRTVAKYRLNADIPNITERNQIYKSGEKSRPYQVPQ